MKKTVLLVCYLILILSLGGCRLVRIEEEKRMPLEYEVVEPEQLPEEAAALVEEKKASEFRVTYQSGKELYLIRGYGKQMSGGYSIQVKELSASSTVVFFETKLMGPSAEEQSGAPSYPYIAVKIQYRKEPVQFQ